MIVIPSLRFRFHPSRPGTSSQLLYRVKNPSLFLLSCLTVLAPFSHGQEAAPPVSESVKARPNFVIIAVDDLRTELGIYGVERAITPNFDRLAKTGVRFDKAYCQQALCAPSRASVMSGLLPVNSGITAMTSVDEEIQHGIMTKALTWPQHFKENGYNTLSLGKVFHNYQSEDDDAWTDGRRAKGSGYMTPRNRKQSRDFKAGLAKGKKPWQLKRGAAVEKFEGDGEGHQDYGVATGAIELLREYHGKDKPFMLALGFYKPHLPFVAPKKYWDLYDRASIEVPSRDEPAGGALHALVADWYEVRHYSDIPKHDKDLSDKQTRQMIHGYLACVSYINAMLGRVLDEMDALGLAENTYTALWSDHGYMLGDYGDWSKYTAMEMDVKIPFLFSGPGIAENKVSQTPVELIDLYPTLCDLAGLPTPDHVEATSLLPELREPNSSGRTAAFSFYDRAKPSVYGKDLDGPPGQAYSVRTGKYRYTEWYHMKTGELLDTELYDHSNGPVAVKNLAKDPAHAEEVQAHKNLIANDPRFKIGNQQ